MTGYGTARDLYDALFRWQQNHQSLPSPGFYITMHPETWEDALLLEGPDWIMVSRVDDRRWKFCGIPVETDIVLPRGVVSVRYREDVALPRADLPKPVPLTDYERRCPWGVGSHYPHQWGRMGDTPHTRDGRYWCNGQ